MGGATELARDSAGALVPARVGVARASDNYSVVCSTVYNRARRNISKIRDAKISKMRDARVEKRKPKEAV